MKNFDNEIKIIDKTIVDNINLLTSENYGLISKNVLSQLRNFVEAISCKIYISEQTHDYNKDRYATIKAANAYVKTKGNLSFLSKFHNLLQKSVSHYTFNDDYSERFILKYYRYLVEIKKFLYEHYKINVLENINDLIQNTDTEINSYYQEIAKVIDENYCYELADEYKDRYYIHKVKPFIVGNKIYYEVIFSSTNVNNNKFDRLIGFTDREIFSNYAVKLKIYKTTINILDSKLPILLIKDYDISIRQCEIRNFIKLFGITVNYSTSSKEYFNLMKFLKQEKVSLDILVKSDDRYYNYIKTKIISDLSSHSFFDVLDKCREISASGKPGKNILEYLLYRMNNKIIKAQTSKESNTNLSGLYLEKGSIPFEKMPYCTSLRKHNPPIYDLLDCIEITGKEYELFVRCVKNIIEKKGSLFVPLKELEVYGDVDTNINKYNKNLYFTHNNRKLMKYKNYVYINEYVQDAIKIMDIIDTLSSEGIGQYTNSIKSWLTDNPFKIDDDKKIEILYNMFSETKIAVIHGAAGTGKSTLIDYVSQFWSDKNRLYLTNTHTALDNLKEKIKLHNSNYSTIASVLSKLKNTEVSCDILIIDECSTVSNTDVRKILENVQYELVILVGDSYQIESIGFGNWFEFIKGYIKKEAYFELENHFRTNDKFLKECWKRVRNCEDSILELLVQNEYVSSLDSSIFTYNENEIILCLNYDGLYGINNINRYLQSNNFNPEFNIGVNTYKVGDPVLFNDSNIFTPLIHNNTKGKIASIKDYGNELEFSIELDFSINSLDAKGYNFTLKENNINNNSIISFKVSKYKDSDSDNDTILVPFQIAYAISIHKSQGLEFDSVKIVITNNATEKITHSIFYTAITRAKQKLKIYWSKETENIVLESFKNKKINSDMDLLLSKRKEDKDF